MKLVTYLTDNGELRPGVSSGNSIVDLLGTDATLPDNVRSILAFEALEQVAAAVASPKAVHVENAVLRAPIPDPQKIICIGLNYRNHAVESGMAIPEEPIVFCKYPSAVTGPEQPIQLPSLSSENDYEAELVAVIGRRAKNVPESQAMDYVAGYTVGNDVSARDWQLKKPGGQWMLGKTFDTFAPIGPALVTKDEISDPENLAIKLRLNGETMQDSTTSELIFGIRYLVAYLSQVFTLEPGDLLFTGTPPGVGFARKPQVFLKPGDLCEVEIEGLGILRNSCEQD
ncbi:MAG: fumarylacetoacetate hydrolase family protein [Pirellulales bacterium]